MNKARIMVTVGVEKEAIFHLAVEGKRVAELSALEVHSLAENAISSLRFVVGEKLAR